MAEKYVTHRPRWFNDTPWLFRVVRETPQRLYVEPYGENPDYFSPAKGRRGDKYIDRGESRILKAPENIEAFWAAWRALKDARNEADRVCGETKAAAEREFDAKVEGL